MYWLARHRPYALVMLSGLLLAAAYPPSPLNHLIYIALVPLLLLSEKGIVEREAVEDGVFLPFKRVTIVLWRLLSLQFIWRKGVQGRQVFRYVRQVISGNAQLFRFTYAAFFLWNLICCYWLILPALDAADFGQGVVNVVSGVLAIALNPLLMVLPLQLHARIRHFIAPELAGLALIVFWLSFEYLHLHWELSFPWLTLGNALSFHPELTQIAEFTGVLGVSAQILLVNWFVYIGVRWMRRKLYVGLLAMGAAASLLVATYVLGAVLTDPARPALQTSGSLRVRIIQPNIDPYAKEDGFTADKQVAQYACMILSEPLDSGRIILLPEKAIDQAMEPRSMLKSRMLAPLWAIVDSYHVEILTGLEDFEDFDDTIEAPISARENYRLIGGKRQLVYSDYYNSAWIMHANRSTQVYRKGQLIPMVERVPFLRGLRTLKFLHIDPAKGMLSYGRPDALHLLYTEDSIATNVLICYESAFGDPTRLKTAMGAQWIAMLTNDAWWRQSSGYVQHAGMSILRAIENRRSLVRCANNGRSMIVSATGEVSQATDWSTEAVIDATIPLYQFQTFYVRYGDYIGQWASVLTLVLVVVGFILHFRKRRQDSLR